MDDLKFPTVFNPADTALLAKLRARAKTDKIWLANEVLGYSFVPEVHQELFDTFIQYDSRKPWAEQSAITKRLILWSRGHYKTTAVVVDIIQLILNFPDVTVLIMQGTMKTTRNLLREIASHFLGIARDSRLYELFPDYCGVKDPKTGLRKISKKGLQLTADAFITPARTRHQIPQATVTVASPDSLKTGQHYDVGYFDDLVHEKNYRNTEQLQKAETNYVGSIPLLNPPFYVVMTGTRYAHGDMYANIIAADKGKPEPQREWIISIRTCWRDDGSVRFPQQAKKSGELMGFTREDLISLRDSNPAMFSAQYLLQPASTANQEFTREQFEARLISTKTMNPDDLSSPYMFVDLAVGSHGSRDDAVILIGKTDSVGGMYVTACRGGKWSTTDLALQIINMAFKSEHQAERPVVILFEPSAAGTVFVDHLRLICQNRGIHLPLDFLESNTTKDAKFIRIQSLDSYMRSDRLFFYQGLEAWDSILEQVEKWTGEKHDRDDYLDTIALMVTYFAERVPVRIPLLKQKFAMLKFLESGTDITNPVTQQPEEREEENGMGDGFSY